MDYIRAQPQTKPNELALREILRRAAHPHRPRFPPLQAGHGAAPHRTAHVQVNALPDMPSYARYLQGNPEETPALLADMLIGVTNFFRDREAFEALERDIIPVLFEQKLATDDRALRVWAAACSTGEKPIRWPCCSPTGRPQRGRHPDPAVRHRHRRSRPETARAGVYPEAIVTDVTPARLRQYFVKDQNQLRLQKRAARADPLRPSQHPARPAVLAARPDLLPQPDDLPDRDIQIEVLRMFHFALNPGATSSRQLPETADVRSASCSPRWTRRTASTAPRKWPRCAARPRPGARLHLSTPPRPPFSEPHRRHRKFSFADVHQRALEQYAPPSVIVNQRRRSCTCPTAPGTSCAMSSVASPH